MPKAAKKKVTVESKRTHEENQERAYIAASRRSDRSLEARCESARRASIIHKQRTGRALNVNEEAVAGEEMYEEVEDDIPTMQRRLAAWHQTERLTFNQRLHEYMGTQTAQRNAFMFAQQQQQQQQQQSAREGPYPQPFRQPHLFMQQPQPAQQMQMPQPMPQQPMQPMKQDQHQPQPFHVQMQSAPPAGPMFATHQLYVQQATLHMGTPSAFPAQPLHQSQYPQQFGVKYEQQPHGLPFAFQQQQQQQQQHPQLSQPSQPLRIAYPQTPAGIFPMNNVGAGTPQRNMNDPATSKLAHDFNKVAIADGPQPKKEPSASQSPAQFTPHSTPSVNAGTPATGAIAPYHALSTQHVGRDPLSMALPPAAQQIVGSALPSNHQFMAGSQNIPMPLPQQQPLQQPQQQYKENKAIEMSPLSLPASVPLPTDNASSPEDNDDDHSSSHSPESAEQELILPSKEHNSMSNGDVDAPSDSTMDEEPSTSPENKSTESGTTVDMLYTNSEQSLHINWNLNGPTFDNGDYAHLFGEQYSHDPSLLAAPSSQQAEDQFTFDNLINYDMLL